MARNRARASLRLALAAALAAGAALAGAGSSPAAAPRTLDVPVLMYHRIDRLAPRLPAITRRLTVTPADFDAQMQWLHAHGWHAVSGDVLAHAAPELRRLRMPAVDFVISGRVSGPDPSFLSWRNLGALERDGVAIGSHTVTHRALAGLPAAVQLQELAASRAALQTRLHRPVRLLAYPMGSHDATTVAMAARAGYELAFTTQAGRTQEGSRPLELQRYEVLDTTGVRGLAALLGRSAGG